MSLRLLPSLFVLCLLAAGTCHVTSTSEKGDCSNPEHAAPLSTHPHSQGSWLIKQLTEGDARLKEQLKEGDSNIKELLREGDANLKELLVEGVTRLKEQQVEDTARMKELVNEEYGRLKRRLVEDVEKLKKDLEEGMAKLREERKEGDDWLRDQITRAETHLTEELTRELTQKQTAMEELREKVGALTDTLHGCQGQASGQRQPLASTIETTTGGLGSQQHTGTTTGQPGTTQLETANATDVLSCATDWVAFQDSCYAFLDIRVTWSTAKAICEMLGAQMLEVESPAENDFVAAQLESDKTDKVWMGINDFVREGQWVFNGNGRPVTYFNWDKGEPTNNMSHNKEGGENCGTMMRTGRWNDLWCEKSKDPKLTTPRVVCEKSILQ